MKKKKKIKKKNTNKTLKKSPTRYTSKTELVDHAWTSRHTVNFQQAWTLAKERNWDHKGCSSLGLSEMGRHLSTRTATLSWKFIRTPCINRFLLVYSHHCRRFNEGASCTRGKTSYYVSLFSVIQDFQVAFYSHWPPFLHSHCSLHSPHLHQCSNNLYYLLRSFFTDRQVQFKSFNESLTTGAALGCTRHHPEFPTVERPYFGTPCYSSYSSISQ